MATASRGSTASPCTSPVRAHAACSGLERAADVGRLRPARLCAKADIDPLCWRVPGLARLAEGIDGASARLGQPWQGRAADSVKARSADSAALAPAFGPPSSTATHQAAWPGRAAHSGTTRGVDCAELAHTCGPRPFWSLTWPQGHVVHGVTVRGAEWYALVSTLGPLPPPHPAHRASKPGRPPWPCSPHRAAGPAVSRHEESAASPDSRQPFARPGFQSGPAWTRTSPSRCPVDADTNVLSRRSVTNPDPNRLGRPSRIVALVAGPAAGRPPHGAPARPAGRGGR